jgi:hypothetical protein
MYNINSRHTNCSGKISTEQQTYEVINKILSSQERWWIGLVGKEEVFDRHIQMCQSLGIPSHRMVIIERDLQIFESLESKNLQKNYNCLILHGDFLENLSALLIKGCCFSFVDFDATSTLSIYEIKLVDLYKKFSKQIEVLRIVSSVREKRDPFYIKLSYFLNLPLYYRALYMGLKNKEIILSQCLIPKVINQIKKDNINHALPCYKKYILPKNMIFSKYCESQGFYCLYENYKGISIMRNFIISNNKNLLNYRNLIKPNEKVVKKDIFGNQIEKIIGDHNLTSFYLIGKNIFHDKYGIIATIKTC